ncbi:MAG: hypothetical protein GY803_24650 [Chloroflexi bacterium]|nr:hypothetical protein [Chloroflexota bacterium]
MSRLINNQTSPRSISELRFIAKSISALALLTGLIYLRAVGMESVTAVRGGEWGQNSVILFFLLVVATLGVLCAWRLEALGGSIAIVSGVGVAILAYLTVEDNKLFTTFAYSSPFLIAGGLSLACWRRGLSK